MLAILQSLLSLLLLLAITAPSTISDASADYTPGAASRVVSLTADMFHAVAKDDTTKHVFVKFYTPWCSHCKEVAPVWDRLSFRLQDRPDVIIAELNAEDNKFLAKEENAHGFPTFLYYTKQGKQGIPYKGQRTLEGFENFARNIGHY